MRSISAATWILMLGCAQTQKAAEVPFADLVGREVLKTKLDSISRDWLKETPAAGMTVAVLQGRDTLLLEGIGMRERDKHLPADRNTVYRVGSITKQFTAAAVMRLVEQG